MARRSALHRARRWSGAFAGVVVAHLMFGEPLLVASAKVRAGSAQILSEFVATFGLVAVIWGCSRQAHPAVALRRGRVHHGGLLVYRFHFVREPCGDAGTGSNRHVRRHPASRCPAVHRRAVSRRLRRDCSVPLAAVLPPGSGDSGSAQRREGAVVSQPHGVPVVESAIPLSQPALELVKRGVATLWSRISSADPRAEERPLLLSYDVHPTPQGPVLIEVNTNAGGIAAAMWAARHVNVCCAEWEHATLEKRLLALFQRDLLGDDSLRRQELSRSLTTIWLLSRCFPKCTHLPTCCVDGLRRFLFSMQRNWNTATVVCVGARWPLTASTGAARIFCSTTHGTQPYVARYGRLDDPRALTPGILGDRRQASIPRMVQRAGTGTRPFDWAELSDRGDPAADGRAARRRPGAASDSLGLR